MPRNALREEALGRNASAARLERALELLVDLGEVAIETGKTNGGRPPVLVRRLRPEERARAIADSLRHEARP